MTHLSEILNRLVQEHQRPVPNPEVAGWSTVRVDAGRFPEPLDDVAVSRVPGLQDGMVVRAIVCMYWRDGRAPNPVNKVSDRW